MVNPPPRFRSLLITALLAALGSFAWLGWEARSFGTLALGPSDGDATYLADEPNWFLPGRSLSQRRWTALVGLALAGAAVGATVGRIGPAAAWFAPLYVGVHPASGAVSVAADADLNLGVIAAVTVAGCVLASAALARSKPSPRRLVGVAVVVVASLVLMAIVRFTPALWQERVETLIAPTLAAPGSGWFRGGRGTHLLVLAVLLALGHWGRQERDEWRLFPWFTVVAGAILALPAPSTAVTGAYGAVGILGLAGLTGVAAARIGSTAGGTLVLASALGVLALASHNTRPYLDAHAAERVRNVQLQKSLIHLRDSARDPQSRQDVFIVGPPELQTLARIVGVGAWVGDALPTDFSGMLHRYQLAPNGYDVLPVLEVGVVPEDRLRLVEPPNGAVIPAVRPEDEPTFRWSIPVGEDPGAAGFAFLAVGIPDGAPHPVLHHIPLSPEQLERRDDGEHVHYGWRPAVRAPMGHRELRWERGELTRRGTRLSWTVVARIRGRLHGRVMAQPRILSALADQTGQTK